MVDGEVRESDDVAAPRPTLTALTGVRALAAAAVLVYHLREYAETLLPWTRELRVWTASGHLGVDVFFVLSGFIVSYTYAERFATFRIVDYRAYLVARFARIYPVYLVTLLFAGVVVGWWALDDRGLSAASFLGNVVLLQTFPGVRAWNMPSWSVCCEVGAYIVFPLVAGALVRLRAWTATALAAFVVLLLVVAVVLIFGMEGDFPFNLYYWTRLTAEFAIGCLLWAAWRHRARRGRAWDAAALVAVVLAAAVVRHYGRAPLSFLVVGCIGLFVVSAASASGPVGAVLASRGLEWGGRMSYAVYLVHYPLFVAMFAVLPAEQLATSPLPVRLGVVVLCFVAPMVLAVPLYYLVEEPARRAIRRAHTGLSEQRTLVGHG